MDLLARSPAFDVEGRRTRLRRSLRCSAGTIQSAWTAHSSAAAGTSEALWRRDASAWSRDPAVQRKIADRLGWLTSPQLMADSVDRLRAFAETVRRDGFTDVVLLGMGGSSLAPEVLRAIIGVAPGFPRFHMLDSTDPAAVRSVATAPVHTLYLLASKSGTTIEPNSLAAHFRHALQAAGVDRWSNHFVAITDPDTALSSRARDERFRDVFLNPPDIGGRYSALSFFGLVPAALMGQDLEAILGWGAAMLAAAQEEADARDNPAVALGLLMAAAAHAGRDKLTLLLPTRLEPFGLWVEQLVAESTGKQGVGVIPIAGERPMTAAGDYGPDRVFAYARLGGDREERPQGPSDDDLKSAGLPCASIDWLEPAALGAEFIRWEVATAVAGALLQINPFDEPNVQQAKDATRVLLETYKARGELPRQPVDRTLAGGATVTASRAARERFGTAGTSAVAKLTAAGDYVAVLAFLGPDPALAEVLDAFRASIGQRTGAATMLGYGPRYLHSTGQLHKGGPNSGVFVLITATPASDLAIPGEPFSFGTLELAQGLGDFESLDATGRRAVHVHLPVPEPAALQAALNALEQAE